MSQDICITKTKTYGSPCFLDENNQPLCEYEVEECGLSLVNIPKNAETEKLFAAASRTGHAEILSQADIAGYVSEVRGFFEPSEQGIAFQNMLKSMAASFAEEASTIVAKYRK